MMESVGGIPRYEIPTVTVVRNKSVKYTPKYILRGVT
jgi:hypothetical protein